MNSDILWTCYTPTSCTAALALFSPLCALKPLTQNLLFLHLYFLTAYLLRHHRLLFRMNGVNIDCPEIKQQTPVSSRLIKALWPEHFETLDNQLEENRRNYEQTHANFVYQRNVVQNPHTLTIDKKPQYIRQHGLHNKSTRNINANPETPQYILALSHLTHFHVYLFNLFHSVEHTQ